MWFGLIPSSEKEKERKLVRTGKHFSDINIAKTFRLIFVTKYIYKDCWGL